MRRFTIGIVTMLIICCSGQIVAQSPGDVAGIWLGMLKVGDDSDRSHFAVRLSILHTPGLPQFEGTASHCFPAPCEPPDTAMTTFTGHFIQGNFFVLFPVLTSTVTCAPGSFNVTGTFNEARKQITMTGGGRNDDCQIGTFSGTFDMESSNFPVSAIISSPETRKVFGDGESIFFQAKALNAIGQEVEGASLVWKSDKDGQIGIGTSFNRNDLSKGKHQINILTTQESRITIMASSLSISCLEELSTDRDIFIHLVTTSTSTCESECEYNLFNTLIENGIEGVRFLCCPDVPKACIGFDPSRGGTIEGAQCLEDLLGSPYRIDSTCNNNIPSVPYYIHLE